MRRFVVLHHVLPAGTVRGTHWDFMIENGGVLRTWALEREPVAGLAIPALSLADHRMAYLEYEGPVTGDRGTVARWDQGTCDVLHSDDERWLAELTGTRLHGSVELMHQNADHWTFRFSSGRLATPR